MKIEKYMASYFAAGLGSLGSSFIPGISLSIFLRISGIILLLAFFLFLLAFRFKWHWLLKIIEHLYLPAISLLASFFAVYGFSKMLIQTNYLFAGFLFFSVASIVICGMIGTETGKGLRQVFDKLNIFIPSEKIPKDL